MLSSAHLFAIPHNATPPQAALLNQHFASMYKGKLLVRFDDTNPSKASAGTARGCQGREAAERLWSWQRAAAPDAQLCARAAARTAGHAPDVHLTFLCPSPFPNPKLEPWLQEKDEYVENIIADMQRLGLPCDAITYTSDYFPQLKDCGERLIRAGAGRAGRSSTLGRPLRSRCPAPRSWLRPAGKPRGPLPALPRSCLHPPAGHLYADDTPVEQMRDERMHGVESRCRGRSVEENLRLWGEMFAGSEEGACV